MLRTDKPVKQILLVCRHAANPHLLAVIGSLELGSVKVEEAGARRMPNSNTRLLTLCNEYVPYVKITHDTTLAARGSNHVRRHYCCTCIAGVTPVAKQTCKGIPRRGLVCEGIVCGGAGEGVIVCCRLCSQLACCVSIES